ncbi:hypothetical protein KAI04_00200 [Candidatus Pacearchaeota archaeon]|nr:hypothetical protein [Candidatus Pacearchaeota archaeon]
MIYVGKNFSHKIDDRFKVSKEKRVNPLEKKVRKKRLVSSFGIGMAFILLYCCANSCLKKQQKDNVESYGYEMRKELVNNSFDNYNIF